MRIAKTFMALAVFLALAASAGATMLIPSSLQKMTADSDAIVLGRVQSQSTAATGAKIYTTVVVAVTEWFKSETISRPLTINLRIPGGTVEGTTMRVDLAPDFESGEEVLLFLKKAESYYVPYALSYGVCRLTVSGDGLTTLVGGPLFSTGQVYDFTARRMVLNTVPLGGEPLTTFRGRIEAEIQKGAE